MVLPGLVSYKTSQTRVCEFSPDDARLSRMRQRVTTWARVSRAHMRLRGEKFCAVMVTLTYEEADGWDPRHISAFLDAVRKWGQRNSVVSIPYAWTMELQSRGAPHYHVLLFLPSRLFLPRPDKARWWRHGSSNVVRVKWSAVGYIAKYATKGPGQLGKLPKGARIAGRGGLPVDCAERDEALWFALPRWVREWVQPGESDQFKGGRVRRLVKAYGFGRLLAKAGQRFAPSGALWSWRTDDGELLSSPFVAVFDPVRRVVSVYQRG